MTITIELNTDNAAFENGRHAEVQRILKAWIKNGARSGVLMDINGNKVGSVTVTGQ